MSNPYTIRDPHHTSKYVQVKRQSKCKGCIQDDPTGEMPYLEYGTIMPGERAIRVSINHGPSMRNQTFHPACYFKVRDACIASYLSPAWKVQPEHPLTIVREEEAVETEHDAFYDLCADDIPF